MKCFDGIYFDQAATSYPKPEPVFWAIKEALDWEGGNPGRSGHTLAMRASERVLSAREALADFFGLSDSRGVVFTKNATEALNLAVHVFAKGGGHVLCDDMAHNALLRPLYRLEDAGVIRLSFYPQKGKAEDIARQIEADTVLLCATHASNICTSVCNAEALGALCKKHGIAFVLDASQSAGHIPIRCDRIAAGAVCLPAHKGLYGIMGAGAALFSDLREDYPPFLTGGGGSFSLSRTMPRELPEHFEAGTLPLPAIAAFEAGVKWVKKIGLDEIAHHIAHLDTRLREGLLSIPDITLYGDGGGGILSFTHKKFSPAEIAERLDTAHIAVRTGLHCAPLAHTTLGTPAGGTVRVSVGYQNTRAECEEFLDCLHALK